MRHSRRVHGFTIIELLITVAIMGIITSIAIPGYLVYQARSRRSEGYANLSAIARAETTYFAERDRYANSGGLPWPDYTSQNDGELGTQTLSWDAGAQANFAALGWKPEGETYYSYEVNTSVACACTSCFTASAFGDVDSNGLVSALMYVHPERDGATTACPSILKSFGTPTRLSGTLVYDEVAVNRETDEY